MDNYVNCVKFPVMDDIYDEAVTLVCIFLMFFLSQMLMLLYLCFQ